MISSSRVWLRQAKSDLMAAQYLAGHTADNFYCQVAAKCQQVVEKSVKAIAADLTERGVVTLAIGFNHGIDQYISVIIRAPRPKSEGKSVPDYIRQALRRNRSDVALLMSLAPHRSADMNRLPRNTEYPFHNAQRALIAPADIGIFQRAEIDSYLKLVNTVFAQAQTLMSIAARAPR